MINVEEIEREAKRRNVESGLLAPEEAELILEIRLSRIRENGRPETTPGVPTAASGLDWSPIGDPAVRLPPSRRRD